MNFEQVIGLEVHCELKTKTKMFSAAPVSFGKKANTMINEVDLGMPGTMPVVNKKAVEFAIKVCHGLHMEIDELLCFDRKNYFYSDLPKGFQITQHQRPIGKNGYLDIEVDNEIKRIHIERLHLEEDTAKQSHFDDYTLIDYNRAGIPLIEIVTKPEIKSGKQAAAYLEKLRQILLYTDVSHAKMEEGSMRCDVNVSIRPFGSEIFGTRCEIKNLNSISNVQKAIEFETIRQEQFLLQNKEILQETRRFDEQSQQTMVMRSKGDTLDYKYFTEPNILPIRLDHQWVMNLKKQLPKLADEREKIYIYEHGLSKTDAHILVSNKEISDFYEETICYCQEYQMICHWLLGEIQAYLNKMNLSIKETSLTPQSLGKMILYICDKTISSNQAKRVLQYMMKEGKTPELIINELGIQQISDIKVLKAFITEVLDAHEHSIQDFANGKDKAIGFLVGQVMKKTNGQANPKLTHQLLVQLLKERIQ